jgi:dTDP-4-amino-4,6-dideoxygalactose transaminase
VWERIGKPHGDIACFSFHPRKVLSTGDGGMLTTGDAALDARFRLLRHHGMSVPDTVRHQSAQVVFEEYPVVGFNYRLTDIQAAVGRQQLTRLSEIVSERRRRAARYAELLSQVQGAAPPAEPAWARSNWQSYAVRLDGALDQRLVMQAMLDAGVSTRRAPTSIHRERAYPPGTWHCGVSADACRCGGPEGGACLARGEEIQRTALVLPLYHQMTDADQDRVIAALDEAIRQSRR